MERAEEAPREASALRAAFPATIPVLTGYLCLGAAYGLLMSANGFGLVWTALASLLCFAGSMQYAAVGLLAAGFDPVQALLLSLMVNARHLFYGVSMLEKYRGLGWRRIPLIFGLTDETFSLVSTLEPPEGTRPGEFYLWITALDYSYWVGGSVLGALLGGLLTVDTTGLDFVLTALFVVLFMEQWKKPENRPAGVVGLACTALSLVIFGPENMVVISMAWILAVLLGGRKRLWH